MIGFFNHHYFSVGLKTGLAIRTVVVMIVFDKILRLPAAGAADTNNNNNSKQDKNKKGEAAKEKANFFF